MEAQDFQIHFLRHGILIKHQRQEDLVMSSAQQQPIVVFYCSTKQE